MPDEGLEERMDRLESALTSFVRHTDEAMAEFRAEVRREAAESRQGMAEFRAEVQQDISEMQQ